MNTGLLMADASSLIQVFTGLQNPAGNYMIKVNNKNTRTTCEICSKLIIKTSERRQETKVLELMWTQKHQP